MSGGIANSGNGGNLYLNPGSSSGGVKGSVSFRTVGNASPTYFVSSETLFDVHSQGTVSIESTGSLDIISAGQMHISSANAINFDESFLTGFEIAPEASVSSFSVTVNAQAGSFSVPKHASFTQTNSYTLFNTRVTTNSLFFSQSISSDGDDCRPYVKTAVCYNGYVDMEITGYAGTDCGSDATIGFFVIG